MLTYVKTSLKSSITTGLEAAQSKNLQQLEQQLNLTADAQAQVAG